ncbi:MAG TPA: amino acid permease [Vicinamibacterales bacterium]|nr:amino acid permease [Vicinamibacterales bacterium]
MQRLKAWLYGEIRSPAGPYAKPERTHPWWQVMCLTGVDYFSTLGYQPGIAFLAAGLLAPSATLVLILLTLLCALPVYRRVAEASPHGQGSISMLEELLPRWRGKAFVLCLLGFAVTDFIITITLSAADATAHITENPFFPPIFDHRLGVTMMLLLGLGSVFLKGFKEAIGVAIGIVATYLLLNVVVIAVSLEHIWATPEVLTNWKNALSATHSNPFSMIGVSLLLFPKLALGLSGFETGVMVMPLVDGHDQGGQGRTEEAVVRARIRNTKRLLSTAATIMTVLLLGSSIVTTVLIPPSAFQEGGPANGRAIAYLAHEYLGEFFGTVYDLSTITILWFAGASAMTGLLNLVPRYLPRYGMAPEWARARRPLVLIITLIACLVTWLFDADVEAQGGAYATGVLVLMTSAAFAVMLNAWRHRHRQYVYVATTLVFTYTTVANIIERPEGIKIATWFIVSIIFTSLVSRVWRSTELRIYGVVADGAAQRLIDDVAHRGQIRIIANRPDTGEAKEYEAKLREARQSHHLATDMPVLFLEVRPGDASEFSNTLAIEGHDVHGYRVLRCTSPAVPNAIAALLLYIRDRTGLLPHAYFGWTEGNPIAYLLKFLAFGEGDTAPVAREVLRQVEPDPLRRPRIHLG